MKDSITTTRTDLRSFTKTELATFCEELGLYSFRTDQIFQLLYQKDVSDFEEMRNR